MTLTTPKGIKILTPLNFLGYQIFPYNILVIHAYNLGNYSKSCDKRWKTGHLYSSKVPAAFIDFVKRK